MTSQSDRIASVILAHTPGGGEGATGNVNCWCGARYDFFADHAKHVADKIVNVIGAVEDFHGKTTGSQQNAHY